MASIRTLTRNTAGRLRARETTHGDPAHVRDVVRLLGGSACGGPVLDLGCGRGEVVSALRESRARAFGIDLRLPPLAGLGGLAQADARALPFADSSFGGAVSILLLHYFRDAGPVLGEVGRVLRPGGVLVLIDRITSKDPEERTRHEAIERARNADARRFRTLFELRELGRAAGFAVEPLHLHRIRIPVADWLTGVPRDALPPLRKRLAVPHPVPRDGGLGVENGRVVLTTATLLCRRV